MLQILRTIAFGEHARRETAGTRVLRHAIRALAFGVMLTYLCDAINIDVIYAAISGDMQYHDNPAILDSQFDTGNTATLIQLPGGHTATNAHTDQVLYAPQKCVGTIVYEDVDSPTVLDADSQTDLVYEVSNYTRCPDPAPLIVHTPLDRTISFLRILI